MADRLVRGTVVTAFEVIKDGWVAMTGERLDAVGRREAPPAGEILEYGEHLILPGLVDGHMHTGSAVGWPGIEGATRPAAAGGVTTCVDMPYDVRWSPYHGRTMRARVAATMLRGQIVWDGVQVLALSGQGRFVRWER